METGWSGALLEEVLELGNAVASKSWRGGKEVAAPRESLQEEFSLHAFLFYPSKIHFGLTASRVIR